MKKLFACLIVSLFMIGCGGDGKSTQLPVVQPGDGKDPRSQEEIDAAATNKDEKSKQKGIDKAQGPGFTDG